MEDTRIALIRFPKEIVSWNSIKNCYDRFDRITLDKNISKLNDKSKVKVIPFVKIPFQPFCNLIGDLSKIDHKFARGIQNCKTNTTISHKSLKKLIDYVEKGEIKVNIPPIIVETYKKFI